MPIAIIIVRTRRRIIIVDHSLRAQIRAIALNQIPRPIKEIRIPLHIRHSIQPRQRLPHETLILRVRAPTTVDPELRQPDRQTRLVVRELDVVLQVREGVDVVVPVQVDEVDLAAGAVAHEVSQICETAGRSAVGDGGGAEACLPGERHHVGFVGGDGGVDGHAGGVAVVAGVGLVEGHEGGRAGVEGGLRVGGPDGGEAGCVGVEEWDPLDRVVEGAGVGGGVLLAVPVVAPADAGVLALQGIGEGVGVVGVAEAALAVVDYGDAGGSAAVGC